MRTSITATSAVRTNLAQQLVAVAGLADDVEACGLEQPYGAGAQQHGVLGYDDPQRLLDFGLKRSRESQTG